MSERAASSGSAAWLWCVTLAERRHKQINLALIASIHRDPPLAEVNLKLSARWRLEPHRRQRLSRKLTPKVRYRPLDRAKADGHTQFRRQFLAHYVGVATMTPETFRKPIRVSRQ
jgi:hypothetical protein